MAEPPAAVLSHRRVLAIATPIVLSNAAVPLLGLVDTGVIGRMGTAAPLGAVGLGAVVLTSVYWLFGFLRQGTTGLVAQAHGARRDTGPHLLRGVMLGLSIGLLLVALQVPLIAGALSLAPASAEVEGLARQYLSIRIWGAPATIALYAINGWLIGVERTRAVLLQQLVITFTNVVLDIWFVLGLGWGVGGVAAATLVAEYTGLAFGLWLARGALAHVWGRAGLFARDELARLATVNLNLMARAALLQMAFTSFMFMGAAQGDVTLAANQVLMQFLGITAYALDGFAFAAETLVGQAVGARRPAAVRRASILTAQWGVAGSLLLGAVFFAAGPAIIDALTTSPEVRAAARDYLPWLAVAPAIGVASWMLDGIFIGATLTREMRLSMMLSFAIYAAALAVLPRLFGNHGLWAALMVLNLLRGATMALFYRRAERAAGAPG